MEWLTGLGHAIEYIEEHLDDEKLNADSLAKEVAISNFYFQKGFAILTGMGIGEYIRNRRLYVAAIEIAAGAKVIDVAMKYCWETPESFSKAFSRFHGTSPNTVKGNTQKIRVFLPLKINVSVSGGEKMNYRIEKKDGFKVIGFKKTFELEKCYKEIPEYWYDIKKNYYDTWCATGIPNTPCEQAIKDNNLGEYGICLDHNQKDGTIEYLCAGNYKGGEVPAEMTVAEIPALQWAVFECYGPLPGAIQTVNTEIFKNWLPANGKYRICADYNVEWYSNDDMDAPDYRSEIWIPVEKI